MNTDSISCRPYNPPLRVDRTELNVLTVSRNQLLRPFPYAPSDQRQRSQYTALCGQKAISCRKFHRLPSSTPRRLSNWLGNFLERTRTRQTSSTKLKNRAKTVRVFFFCPVSLLWLHIPSSGHSPRHYSFTQHKKLRIYGRRHRHLNPFALLCVHETLVLVRQKWRFRRCGSFTVQIGVLSL